jgi:hypothetical protein
LCAQEKAIDAMDSAVLANLAQSIDADVVHGNEYIRAVLEDMHTSIQADPT